MSKTPVHYNDGWAALRRQTPARLALGLSGISLPTGPHLAFQLAHAQARDAVHAALDAEAVASAIEPLGLGSLRLHSAATDRSCYLRRPDLGRVLDANSRRSLAAVAGKPYDLAFVIADGLSAAAVNQYAAPLLAATLDLLDRSRWHVAPALLVAEGRVAVGDEIGAAIGVSLVAVLIGERPGLSAPRSLGIYVTWAPCVGMTDAGRNCISNIRADGLSIADAAQTLASLLESAARHRCTGVALAACLRQEFTPRLSSSPPKLVRAPGSDDLSGK
jgi:ethanolamine ammonia-lyase small subunit